MKNNIYLIYYIYTHTYIQKTSTGSGVLLVAQWLKKNRTPDEWIRKPGYIYTKEYY